MEEIPKFRISQSKLHRQTQSFMDKLCINTNNNPSTYRISKQLNPESNKGTFYGQLNQYPKFNWQTRTSQINKHTKNLEEEEMPIKKKILKNPISLVILQLGWIANPRGPHFRCLNSTISGGIFIHWWNNLTKLVPYINPKGEIFHDNQPNQSGTT